MPLHATCTTASRSAATRPGMVALRGIHNETLRGHPLKALGPSLAGLTRLRSLLVSDPHLELRTANAILGCMGGLAQLEDLVMPEARVGAWKQFTFVTGVVLLGSRGCGFRAACMLVEGPWRSGRFGEACTLAGAPARRCSACVSKPMRYQNRPASPALVHVDARQMLSPCLACPRDPPPLRHPLPTQPCPHTPVHRSARRVGACCSS